MNDFGSQFLACFSLRACVLAALFFLENGLFSIRNTAAKNIHEDYGLTLIL